MQLGGTWGAISSPGQHFVLSGLVLNELRWRSPIDSILQFRRAIRARYGLKVWEEIHSADMTRGPGELARIHKSVRLRILKHVLEFQAKQADINIVNVVVDKAQKTPPYNVFENAWVALLRRFANTIQYGNFPGLKNQTDCGIIAADNTDVPKLRRLVRKLQVYNPVPNTGGSGYRQLPLQAIIKDPIHRDSADSYFIQLADVNAYFLKQKLSPSGYIKRKGARNYFDRLQPVLCKHASGKDPDGNCEALKKMGPGCLGVPAARLDGEKAIARGADWTRR